MAIFWYTLKKYLKSKSTWVITIITVLLIVMLFGYVAIRNVTGNNVWDSASIVSGIIITISLFSSFLCIFTSVFAAFKGATLFKDEVEDGTFLVIVSKPISRTKIIIYKWLALVAIITIYSFLSGLAFLISILVFDHFGSGEKIIEIGEVSIQSLSSHAVVISLYMVMILFVMSLIFSSIALLLSVKLSVGSTIGATVALGAIIPITTLISTFTVKKEYNRINWSTGYQMQAFSKEIAKERGYDVSPYEDNLYELGLKTNDEDTFKKILPFDLNYQVNTLAKYALNTIIPQKYYPWFIYQNANAGWLATPPLQWYSRKNYHLGTPQENRKLLNKLVVNTWEYNRATRNFARDKLKEMFEVFFNDNTTHLRNENGHEVTPENVRYEWDEYHKYLSKTYLTQLGVTHHTHFDKDYFTELFNIKDSDLEQLPPDDQSCYWNIMYACARIPFDWYKSDFAKSEISKKANEDFIKEYNVGLQIIMQYSIETIAISNNRLLSEFLRDKGIQEIQSNAVFDWRTLNNDINSPDKDSPGLFYVQFWKNNYERLLNAMNHGYQLAKVESKNYAEKSNILLIYLAIAFGILPFAFIVIKRSDYR